MEWRTQLPVDEQDPAPESTFARPARRRWYDGILLTVEILAVLGLAGLMAGVVRSTAGTFLPYLQDFTIAGEVLMFCLNATVGVGLLSTFIPAYQAVRRPIIEGLRAL